MAWKAAAERPERLHSLTAVSMPHPDAFLAALRTDGDQRRRSRYVLLFRAPCHLAEWVLLRNEARRLRSAYQGKVPADRVADYVGRLRDDGAMTAALNWYRAADRKARVGPVSVPTLFVWGTQDQALGPTAAAATAKYVHGPYRFESLPDASHWLLEETPTVLARMLQEQFERFGRGD